MRNNPIMAYSKIITVIARMATAAGAERLLIDDTIHPTATQAIATIIVLSTRRTIKNHSGSISLNHHCVINLDLRTSQVAGNDAAKYDSQPKAIAATVRHLLSRTVLTTSARIADRTCRQYHHRDG